MVFRISLLLPEYIMLHMRQRHSEDTGANQHKTEKCAKIPTKENSLRCAAPRNTATSYRIERAKPYLKNIPVQKHHYDTGYVEAAQRWEYDEVTVVEHAQVGRPCRCAVQAEHNGRADGHRDRPHQQNGDADAFAVAMPRVFDRLRDCDVAAGFFCWVSAKTCVLNGLMPD